MFKFDKLDIPKSIKHIRLDVGTSFTAPNSAAWLVKQENTAVFAFEPHPKSFKCLVEGVTAATGVGGSLESHGVRQDGMPGIANPGEHHVIASKQAVAHCSPLVHDALVAKAKELKVHIYEQIEIAKRGNWFVPFNVAISDVDDYEIQKFYMTEREEDVLPHWGCSSLHPPRPDGEVLGEGATSFAFDVPVAPLTKFFEAIDHNHIEYIDMLKSDTQGNDLAVLKSCGEYLKRICFVQCEFWTYDEYEGTSGFAESLEEIVEYMAERGFGVYYVSDSDIKFINTRLVGHIHHYMIDDHTLDTASIYGIAFKQWWEAPTYLANTCLSRVDSCAEIIRKVNAKMSARTRIVTTMEHE